MPVTRMAFHLVFRGSVLPSWRLSSFSSTLYALILIIFLNAGSVHLFSRSRKSVAALTLLTIDLQLSLVFYLKILKLSSTLILDHLESHSLLSDHQYGFRRSRSTGDILSYLTDLLSSALRDFGESCVVALDISKAFDRVWHASLLSKLTFFGFPPSLCLLLSKEIYIYKKIELKIS